MPTLDINSVASVEFEFVTRLAVAFDFEDAVPVCRGLVEYKTTGFCSAHILFLLVLDVNPIWNNDLFFCEYDKYSSWSHG